MLFGRMAACWFLGTVERDLGRLALGEFDGFECGSCEAKQCRVLILCAVHSAWLVVQNQRVVSDQVGVILLKAMLLLNKMVSRSLHIGPPPHIAVHWMAASCCSSFNFSINLFFLPF